MAEDNLRLDAERLAWKMRAGQLEDLLRAFMAAHERPNDPGYVCGCVECCNAEEALDAQAVGGYSVAESPDDGEEDRGTPFPKPIGS